MTKIVRPNLNIQAFALNAQGTERTVFGGTTQSDDLETNLTAGYARGWGIVAAGEKPTKQDFNAEGFTATQLTSYLFQSGVPEWASNQEYHTGSFVNLNGVIYRSMTNNNTGNDPSNSTQWQNVTGSASTSQAGIVKLSNDIDSNDETTAATSKALSDLAELKVSKSEYQQSLITNGWQRLPSGLIIQWGVGAPNSSTGVTDITYPVAFSAHPFYIGFGYRQSSQPSYVQSVIINDPTSTNLGFSCRALRNDGTGMQVSPSAFYWLAVGA